MSLNDTPRGNRLHIAVFGKRNAGKSSLVNALTGQQAALVSEHPGTTTDPVLKSMELHPIGPVVFIDTAGFDDDGILGDMRVKLTKETITKTDVAIMVFDGVGMEDEAMWVDKLKNSGIPILYVINKEDAREAQEIEEVKRAIHNRFKAEAIVVSAEKGTGLGQLKHALDGAVPEEYHRGKILGGLVKEGDEVLLVMPQDIQAPKGRLILPQVQTIRELLDSKCVTICTTVDQFSQAQKILKRLPDLIVTDSQCFKEVEDHKIGDIPVTSFSVLFAAYKGDAKEFAKGARAIDLLSPDSRILIAEACTHAPLTEDIGREKIPALLKQKLGPDIQIDIVAGSDFPEDLSVYDLIVHCGACMFNRQHVLSRVAQAREAGVPISNYGIVMAKMAGILDDIKIPNS